jgi:formylglycine-generating enzyme required for sulfatase activity
VDVCGVTTPLHLPPCRGRADTSSGEKGGDAGIRLGRRFRELAGEFKESSYGQPTPVHMHPGGATPDTGVCDLCGNVWEWSADWSENKYPWLTGGAYYKDADGVRASSRYWHFPWDWYDVDGLRCVVVPGSR